MSKIEIKVVESRTDVSRFIKMQWDIYKNDNYWVAPLLVDRKKILSKKKNPFFQHAAAEYFLAYRDGQIIGRIAAIHNFLHNKYHNDRVGFFGFFECINDQYAANTLFDAAADWLRSRGLTEMRGPASPSSNDEYGLLIEGFDDSPRILMTYNPRYYVDLFDSYGLKKAKDLYAWKLENRIVANSDKLKRVARLAKERAGLEIVEIDMKNFKSEVEKVKAVYNQAWAPNWGFVPLTDAEIDAMAADLKQLAEPSLVLFGYINGELIGFTLTLPDYNQVFKQMNGRLFPFGVFKLLTGKKKITWSRVITLGLIPKYQKRGLDSVFYWELHERTLKLGYYEHEASWILEDNDMMNRAIAVGSGVLYKKYRIYEIPL